MQRFDGRVAIVTGAAQGIGRAIAERLGKEGAQVIAVDLNGEGAAAAAKAIGGKSTGIQCDIGEPASVAKLYADVEKAAGKLDILINAAGIVPFVPWDQVTFEEWRRVMRVNLDGLFLMCKAGSDLMRKKNYGRIVNISSNSIFAGTPNMAHYVASKGGVLALTRELCERHPIALVNSVNPWRLEGQKTAAFELLEDLPTIDGLCIPVGNAGNVTAYWKGFQERGHDLYLYGFQAAGSAPLVEGHVVENPETVASAIRIGNPARWEEAVAAFRG